MNPFLQMLMGQQGGTQLPGVMSGYGGGTFNSDGSEATPVNPLENEILVEANRNNSRDTGPVDGMSAPNDQAITNVQADITRGQEASDRKGMFGVKGTLRDILGLVGDAFLVQGGNNPVYAPQRRQEKISDAMAGFTENPQAAAERVGYYDPKFGQELLSDHEANLVKKAQAESLAASRQSLTDDRRIKQINAARLFAQNVLVQPGALDAEGNITPDALRAISVAAKQANTTPEELIADLQGEAARMFSEAGISAYQRETLEDRDATIAQGQQNADSRRISANAAALRASRPPAGRAPTKESDREAAIRIGNKPADKRTPGEQAFYEKYTRPPSTRERGRGRTGAEPRFGPPRN